MSDVLERLKAGRAAIGRIDLGDGLVLGMKLLCEADHFAATLAANVALKAHGVTDMTVETADLFESERLAQVLSRLLVDVDSRALLFTSASEVRNLLTRKQMEAIAAAYLEHEKQFSPSSRNLSDADLLAVVEEVKKNAQTTHLNDLNTDSLKKLVRILVAQR